MNLTEKLLHKKTNLQEKLDSNKPVKQSYTQHHSEQELNEEQLKLVTGAGSRVATSSTSREST